MNRQRNSAALAWLALALSACTDSGTIGNEGAAGGGPIAAAGRISTATAQAGAPGLGGAGTVDSAGGTTTANVTGGMSTVAPTAGKAGGATTVTSNAPGGGYPAQCGPKILELAQNALSDCKIQNDGDSKVQEIEIPTELTGPNWTIKKNACRDGGWDLSQCAGTNAVFTSFGTNRESEPGHLLTAWVVTQNNRVCCMYESDDANPGIYAASCVK